MRSWCSRLSFLLSKVVWDYEAGLVGVFSRSKAEDYLYSRDGDMYAVATDPRTGSLTMHVKCTPPAAQSYIYGLFLELWNRVTDNFSPVNLSFISLFKRTCYFKAQFDKYGYEYIGYIFCTVLDYNH